MDVSGRDDSGNSAASELRVELQNAPRKFRL